jgi:hypothetical protein
MFLRTTPVVLLSFPFGAMFWGCGKRKRWNSLGNLVSDESRMPSRPTWVKHQGYQSRRMPTCPRGCRSSPLCSSVITPKPGRSWNTPGNPKFRWFARLVNVASMRTLTFVRHRAGSSKATSLTVSTSRRIATIIFASDDAFIPASVRLSHLT